MISRIRAHWRALRQPPPLDLAAPPILAEVMVHVARDGTWRLYAPHVGNAEDCKRIIEALVASGVEYARRNGLSVQLGGQGGQG